LVSVVIPVKNEEERIAKSLDNCQSLPLDKIIIILNGCTDNSKEIILSHSLRNYVYLLEFNAPLGIDIPRAVGAAYAYKLGSNAVLFLDGDMEGEINNNLSKLTYAINVENIDMALTDCYPYNTVRPTIARKVLSYRERLNRSLGLFEKLGVANPSHGPHAISRRLLEVIPWRALAIPPLSLAIAAKANLKIEVATSLPHRNLLSPLRNDDHSILIAETIIGDCLEAICHLKGVPPSREDKGIYYLGYHPERKFDLLDNYVRDLGLDGK
jgi:glycosyltransferase involved in cell wall biosynthesis